MRYIPLLAAAAAIGFAASPADAQNNRRNANAAQGQTIGQQIVAAGGEQPDVLLDIPNLSVDEITIDVQNLEVDISLDARLANLLKLTAGAHASVDQVKIQIKGVQAQATLVVRLENVRAIIERTLQTLDNNPQLVSQLLSTVDNTVNTVGGVANNTVGTVGGIAGSALRTGQVLDLARAGLTEVSRSLNGTGQTVRRVRDTAGQLTEVVTDTAGRIVSSRRVTQ
jgi:hypothetical protein